MLVARRVKLWCRLASTSISARNGASNQPSMDLFQTHSTAALPEDLEREIFEIAACFRPRAIPKLMLVARRVKLWVEPFLYRTLVLSRYDTEQYPAHSMDTVFPILYSPPLRAAVRNFLCTWVPPEDGALVLSRCSGIENLWINGEQMTVSRLLSSIADLPNLKRFHCNLTLLFSSAPGGHIDFMHRLFERITHLELLDYYRPAELERDSERWCTIARLPALTHLAFYTPSFVVIALPLLRTCPNLVVLVLKFGWGSPETLFDARPDAQELVKDLRFVVMECSQEKTTKDWQTGAYTGRDFWTRAEEWIGKRRAGEVDVLEYLVEL
ncbi:hypothetical protein B0H19DRAFT_1089503 [Mycena capillaripes]|nr:hypothetical protein B0H19DRAFT_1089503 [Mycena capillaripes]